MGSFLPNQPMANGFSPLKIWQEVCGLLNIRIVLVATQMVMLTSEPWVPLLPMFVGVACLPAFMEGVRNLKDIYQMSINV